jgi:hypothetical protein
MTPLKSRLMAKGHQLQNFCGRISAVSMTPLKSQTDFTSTFSSFKGKIQKKYFNRKYPQAIQVLKGIVSRKFAILLLVSLES